MKCLLVITALVVIADSRPYYSYSHENDPILEKILNHRSQLLVYMRCMLEKGDSSCNSDARKLKSLMKKALETCCEICTETDRNRIHRVIHHIINKERLYGKKIFTKYDPDSKCLPQYENNFSNMSYK